MRRQNYLERSLLTSKRLYLELFQLIEPLLKYLYRLYPLPKISEEIHDSGYGPLVSVSPHYTGTEEHNLQLAAE